MSSFLTRARGAIASWFAPRYNTSTGRRRSRPAPFVAAGAVLAVLLGSGVAVAATSGADAHIPTITATCSSLDVNLKWYPGGAHVTIVVGGITEVDSDFVAADFEEPGFSRSYSIPADTATSWELIVDAPDGDNGTQWDVHESGVTTPCSGPSIPSLTVTACTAPGQLVDLTANFAGLDQSHTYTVALSSAGGSNVAAAPFVATGNTGSTVFTAINPGYTYTVTLVDTTSGLTATASVDAVGCPQDTDLTISATQCTAAGGSGEFAVTISQLSLGREYAITLLNSVGDVVVGTQSVTADASGTATRTFAVAPSGTYYATVTDVAAGTTRTSAALTFLPCPEKPAPPTLTVSNCTAVPPAGAVAASGATMGISISSLVPGRTYDIVVTDGVNPPVLQVLGLVATSSTYTDSVTGLAPGTYTATVTDTAAPSNTASQSASVLACPTYDTTIDLSANACTELGQSLDLRTTISDYAVGRSYTVVLLQNGVQVGSDRTFDSSTGTAQSLTFSGLTPGATYVVLVIDDLSVPVVTVAESITLGTCPGQPNLSLVAGPCRIIGFSEITATATSLEAGGEYRLSLSETLTGDPVTGVADVTFTASSDTETVVLKDVPNDARYTATIEAIATGLTASAVTRLGICDLPTLPDPPTLALTGTPIGAAALSALVLLQLGFALVGSTLVRRRPRRRA